MSGEWKSVKIKGETYERLKKLGGESISKSIDDLIGAAQSRFEETISDAKSAAQDIANYLVTHGYFDIRFRNLAISNVSVQGDVLHLRLLAEIKVPNKEVLEKIVGILKDRGVKVEGEG